MLKRFHHLLNFGFRLMHSKCVNNSYPRTDDKIVRVNVPIDKIEWDLPFADYSPISYTSPHILAGPPYADLLLSDEEFNPQWNSLDGNINRKSNEKIYDIVHGFPQNFRGRTGITGRGCLGRWGPNHAADPIVTRWKLDDSGNYISNDDTNKRILEFVSIERRDCGEWAIPGGMVDPGERVSSTLLREFMEEAMNSFGMTDDEKLEAKSELEKLFRHGVEIYSGYVDDPRNTDNAWMETVAYNFHEDDTSGLLYRLRLTAGDDAKAVRWTEVSSHLNLYASHKDFLAKVSQKLNAHW